MLDPIRAALNMEQFKASEVRTVTVKCKMCGTPKGVEVPVVGYAEWKAGNFIQEAMPNVSVDDHELLVSGTCPTCWGVVFAPPPRDVLTVVETAYCKTNPADAVLPTNLTCGALHIWWAFGHTLVRHDARSWAFDALIPAASVKRLYFKSIGL